MAALVRLALVLAVAAVALVRLAQLLMAVRQLAAMVARVLRLQSQAHQSHALAVVAVVVILLSALVVQEAVVMAAQIWVALLLLADLELLVQLIRVAVAVAVGHLTGQITLVALVALA
jgi:hypothetical protein